MCLADAAPGSGDDGNIVRDNVDYEAITALPLAEVKELRQRVAELEAA